MRPVFARARERACACSFDANLITLPLSLSHAMTGLRYAASADVSACDETQAESERENRAGSLMVVENSAPHVRQVHTQKKGICQCPAAAANRIHAPTHFSLSLVPLIGTLPMLPASDLHARCRRRMRLLSQKTSASFLFSDQEKRSENSKSSCTSR